MAAQEDKDSPGIVSAAEEKEEFQNIVEEKQEPVLAFATEQYKKPFASSNEKKCDVGIVSNIEEKRETLDSAKLEFPKKTVNSNDCIEEMYFLEPGMGHSGIQECRLLHEEASAESEEKHVVEAQVANEDSVSEHVLEVKKKLLLEELEAVLLPEGEFAGEKVTGCKMVQEDFPIPRSLGIEVIDDTALIETVPAPGIGKKIHVLGSTKCTGREALKEIDIKNGKRSRRAKGAKNALGVLERHKIVTRMDEAQNLSRDRNDGSKRKYSIKEIQAMRFVNMAEQRKTWKAIYRGLDTAVAKEYCNLASSEHQKHIRLNYDPQQCFAKKKEAPAILSVGAANGRWRYMNVFVH